MGLLPASGRQSGHVRARLHAVQRRQTVWMQVSSESAATPERAAFRDHPHACENSGGETQDGMMTDSGFAHWTEAQ